MFEKVTAHAERRAAKVAAGLTAKLAARMVPEAPHGVAVDAVAQGIRLSGCGLRRRLALDPSLRWLAAEARR